MARRRSWWQPLWELRSAYLLQPLSPIFQWTADGWPSAAPDEDSDSEDNDDCARATRMAAAFRSRSVLRQMASGLITLFGRAWQRLFR